MGSITGLKRGQFTSIDNSGQLRVGPEINPGTAGQALVSGGPDEPARWDTHTGTIQPLTMGTNLSLASGNATFDGGTADTINATDTNTQLNLTAALPVIINNGGGLNREVELQYDTNTLGAGGGALQVKAVPNTLQITDSAGTSITYDGSVARTITINDNDNQLNLTQGANITITNTGGLNRTIALNGSLTSVDITDTSNVVSPYFFHDIYDPAGLDSDSLTTSYANIFSSNLVNSFTAKQTSCAIELRVYNAQFTTSGRFTYARLAGSSSTTSGAEFNTFYSTGGRNTERLIHQADESDDVNLTMTWVLTGLTIGNSYNLYPQMRSSSTTNSIYAGGSYPGAVLRGYYLPTSSGDDY